MRVYLATDGAAPHIDLIRTAFHSPANTAIIPMQDFLGLDSEARMNWPGRAEGNWAWRLLPGQLNEGLARWVRSMTLLAQRCSNPPEFAVAHIDEARVNYLEADDRACGRTAESPPGTPSKSPSRKKA